MESNDSMRTLEFQNLNLVKKGEWIKWRHMLVGIMYGIASIPKKNIVSDTILFA